MEPGTIGGGSRRRRKIVGKLNRFFATNTLADGSFWRRCLRTPPSLPRFASCPVCPAGTRAQGLCPTPRAAAPVARAGGALCREAGAAGDGCWGSGSRESGHGSSRAYRNTVSSARQCLKTRQRRTTFMHSVEMLAGRLLSPGNRPRAMPGKGRLGAAALL